MSDVITDSGDSFTRTAGRQLALLALFGVLAFIVLAMLLGWLSKLTSGGSALSEAVE